MSFNMATITIQIAPFITPEIAPATLFSELPTQARRITPRTTGSGINTNPPVNIATRDAATARARIISAFPGTLPEGMEEMLSGAAGTPQAVKWANEHYKAMEGDVFTERCRKPSYIQRFLHVVVCTSAYEVEITK